jgi:hypothetical protein
MGSLGDYVRSWRIYIMGRSLKDFCRDNVLDPCEWSRVECNLDLPPKSLYELAGMLLIRPDTRAWMELEKLHANHVVHAGVKYADELAAMEDFEKTTSSMSLNHKELWRIRILLLPRCQNDPDLVDSWLREPKAFWLGESAMDLINTGRISHVVRYLEQRADPMGMSFGG